MVPRHGAVLVKMATSLARTPAVQQAGASARERLPFDEGWRFAFGPPSDIDNDFSYSRRQSFAKAARRTGDHRALTLPPSAAGAAYG